jgi:O-antigen ligase
MSGAALVWGLRQWPRTVRWWWRLTLASTAGIALIVFSQVAGSYMSRFLSYFQWEKLQHLPPGQMVRGAWDRYRDLDRGQMAAAALRAWKATGPAFGIGPGMHKNLWPHFAASPDGDREAGRWPSSPNNTHYSFEAHNDWVQLLEEYGLAGLALFLLPVSIAFAVLRRGLVAVRPDRPAHRPAEDEPGRYAVMLGGMLAGIGMGFHSLGDFNLQIPATTWLLAAILAAALADAGELRMRRIERRRMEDKS